MKTENLIQIHQDNDFAQHEEIRRMNVQQTRKIDGQSGSIDRLTLAMFGNPDSKEKGTKEKVDEIYDLLIAGNTIRKTLAWAFGVIVAIIYALSLAFNFFKDIKKVE